MMMIRKEKILDSPVRPAPSESWGWLEQEDDRQEVLEDQRIAKDREIMTQRWVENEPEPGAMLDPELPPDNAGTATITTSSVGLEHVEQLMYEQQGARNNPDTRERLEKTHHPWLRRFPLALYRRFESEVAHVINECQHADDYMPLSSAQAEEIVYRQWEHIFSSRMPVIAAPVPTWQGKPHSKSVRYWGPGEWTWELLFMRRFLKSLKLIGDPADHPSRAIRMPKALADSEIWKYYIRNQAWYFEEKLGERNSWLPFLLTRPFVVFRVICDEKNHHRGPQGSESLLGKLWRDNGWWVGGHSHGFQDCDGPGWMWPDENPSYILEDLPSTLMSSCDNWLGNPQGPQQRLDSPPPRAITEEELQDDPDLSKRTPYWDGDWRRRNYKPAWSVTCKAPQMWLKEVLRCHLHGMIPYEVRREKLDFDFYYIVGPGAYEEGGEKYIKPTTNDETSQDGAQAESQVQVAVAESLQSSAPGENGHASLNTKGPTKRSRKAAGPTNGNKVKKPTQPKRPALSVPKTLQPLRRSARVAAGRV